MGAKQGVGLVAGGPHEGLLGKAAEARGQLFVCMGPREEDKEKRDDVRKRRKRTSMGTALTGKPSSRRLSQEQKGLRERASRHSNWRRPETTPIGCTCQTTSSVYRSLIDGLTSMTDVMCFPKRRVKYSGVCTGNVDAASAKESISDVTQSSASAAHPLLVCVRGVESFEKERVTERKTDKETERKKSNSSQEPSGRTVLASISLFLIIHLQPNSCILTQ
ncbi:unnamed protein product [Pleuronectes platessa]|uniref:Uncharacterized protein n=1 Tax=Pleuronectes platessa TaxID=8262 RepID=A0A9N7TMJ8_PLEPL|nr:unnamed protein product [Pleuronectes platessa]